MKYSAKFYAKSFCEAVLTKNSADDCVKNLLLLVEKNRDQKKLKQILQIIEKILSQKTNYRSVLIETARPLTAVHKKTLGGLLKKNDSVDEIIDKEMIAGVKLTINDELQFDGSFNKRIKSILNI